MDDLDSTAIERLRELRLLAPHSRHAPDVLEAHPLIREHYARELSDRFPELFRDTHRRIYEHLTKTTEHQPDTLAGLQPLYQDVRHGCLAGIQQKACDDVYYTRILRDREHYSTQKLGASGANLGAAACFFDEPWRRLSLKLSDSAQGWLLNEAAFHLRALGRLTDALEPMRLSTQMYAEKWIGAALSAANLSELELKLGLLSHALSDGAQSVDFGDRSANAHSRMRARTTYADALHQAGRRDDALHLFREAEAIQAKTHEHRRLYSLPGYKYSDLLMAEAEKGCVEINLAVILGERNEG